MLQRPLPEAVVLSLYCPAIIDEVTEEQVDLPQALTIIPHGEKELNDTLGDARERTLSCTLRLF